MIYLRIQYYSCFHWLSSFRPILRDLYYKQHFFLQKHAFGVSAAIVCTSTLYITAQVVPCGPNCFLIRKKSHVDDLKGVCFSTFTGCHLLLFCSAAAAAHCEAAAAVADLAGWVFCKATPPLVAKEGNDTTPQTSAIWETLDNILLLKKNLSMHIVFLFC